MKYQSTIIQQLTQSSEVKQRMVSACVNDISKAAVVCNEAIKNGNKILLCGNGGSAGDAQHIATEFMGGLRDHNRKPFPAIALTTDTSFLTAWTNDTDFKSVFSRQVKALGQGEDVLIAITTSGNSANVINASKTAKQLGMKVIAFMGESSSELDKYSDVVINIPSKDTQRIQEAHITIGHIIVDIVEQDMSS